MTRVTNLVSRKRKYVSDDGPKASSNPYTYTGDGSGSSSKPRSSFSKPPRGDGKTSKDRAAASEKRRLQRMDERNSEKTCFACREPGHTARECPNAVSVEEGKSSVGICYRCGSKFHTLSRCRKPENKANPLPYASCFVCNGKGHLSGACPSNMNGLYPNGGGCKLCDQNDHLAKDCPTRKPAATAVTTSFLGIAAPDARDLGADEDDFHALKRRTVQVVREEKREERLAAWRPKPDQATASRVEPSQSRQHSQPQVPMSSEQGGASFTHGAALPAFIARGSAAPSMPKTKVVKF